MPQSFHLASLELECHRAQRGPKLCDAQRKQTIENMRLVEIRFVILKERVAISSKVTQPILCFGHFLEHGFGIDGVEQALTHSNGSISIRLQMHNKNTGVLGHVRVLQALPEPDNFQAIRAVKTEVKEGLINNPIAWIVSDMGYIIGRHVSDCFQDSSLAFPALQPLQFRTTLVKGDDGLWP